VYWQSAKFVYVAFEWHDIRNMRFIYLKTLTAYTHPTPKGKYLSLTAQSLTKSEHEVCVAVGCCFYVVKGRSLGKFSYFSGIYYYAPFYDHQESLSISLSSLHLLAHHFVITGYKNQARWHCDVRQ
jgi:hypothetical protein